MNLHFEYNKEEVIKGLRYHFISRSEIKILIILINIFAIVSVGLFFAGKLQSNKLTIFSALWFATMLAVWFLLPNSVYKNTATFKDEIVANLNSDELALNTHKGTKYIPWSGFSHVKESPEFFYLYQNAKSFFLIPKSAAHDDASVPALRKFFNEHINVTP
jgi:hypothetical protein